MQIGFNLPISGPMSAPERMIRIAQQGEALGYDYLTLTDHVVLPDLRVPGYPYSESGEFQIFAILRSARRARLEARTAEVPPHR